MTVGIRKIAVLALLAFAVSADTSFADSPGPDGGDRQRQGGSGRNPGMDRLRRDRVDQNVDDQMRRRIEDVQWDARDRMREQRRRLRDARSEERERMQEQRERFQDARYEERRELRERHLERMRGFHDAGAGWQDAPWRQLSRDDRMAIRDEVESLRESERRELWDNLRRLHALREEERAVFRRRFDRLRALEPGARVEVRDNARRFHQMDPEIQDRLRETLRRFQDLSDEKQIEWLDRALEEAPDSTR